MAKGLYRGLNGFLWLLAVSSSMAAAPSPQLTTAKELKHLGSYLGFDLTNKISSPTAALTPTTSQVYSTMPNIPALLLAIRQVTPVVDNGLTALAMMNTTANYIFKNDYTKETGATTAGKIMLTANASIDQHPRQADPVSQAILNILATPDASCVPVAGTTVPPAEANSPAMENCKNRAQSQVALSVLNPLQSGIFLTASSLYDFSKNVDVIKQLNSNNLIGPLLYDKGTSQASGGSGPLLDANQAQLANDFVLYATSAVNPMAQPFFQRINDLLSSSDTNSQEALANYVVSLRTYAAQQSVAFSNLYSILSRRMPQTNNGQQINPTSEALSEFGMATWRLFNNAGAEGTNLQKDLWVEKINQASPATVQKEMALLLAEMNYQLYLSRQQQERILLTETMLLIQNSHMMQPDPSLTARTAPKKGAIG